MTIRQNNRTNTKQNTKEFPSPQQPLTHVQNIRTKDPHYITRTKCSFAYHDSPTREKVHGAIVKCCPPGTPPYSSIQC